MRVCRFCFHSTKEGFKGDVGVPIDRGLVLFPFHQGRFQGGSKYMYPATLGAFPFHQGRFQGVARRVCGVAVNISFHSTKEGFKVPSPAASVRRPASFHSTKEGFKEKAGRARDGPTRVVSIPPRKVSRVAVAAFLLLRMEFPFHQGRFQGRERNGRTSAASLVSIPPRKVSRSSSRTLQ